MLFIAFALIRFPTGAARHISLLALLFPPFFSVSSEKVLSGTLVILRYLGRAKGLYGNDPEAAKEIDSILHACDGKGRDSGELWRCCFLKGVRSDG